MIFTGMVISSHLLGIKFVSNQVKLFMCSPSLYHLDLKGFHFTDWETEAQRDIIPCPSSHW